MSQDIKNLVAAASRVGDIIETRETACCGILWSSDPMIIDKGPGYGWTRSGTCGKCGENLTRIDNVHE